MPVIQATWEAEIGGLRFEGSPDKQFSRPYLQNRLEVWLKWKTKNAKSAGGVTQVVECLCSKCKTSTVRE
jgi:hypothetical protein